MMKIHLEYQHNNRHVITSTPSRIGKLCFTFESIVKAIGVITAPAQPLVILAQKQVYIRLLNSHLMVDLNAHTIQDTPKLELATKAHVLVTIHNKLNEK